MSDPHMTRSVHKYAYKSGGTRVGVRKTTHIGSSYELDGVVSRFMPCELELVKSNKSKTPKIRNQEKCQEEQTFVNMNGDVRVVTTDSSVPNESIPAVARTEDTSSVPQPTKRRCVLSDKQLAALSK